MSDANTPTGLDEESDLESPPLDDSKVDAAPEEDNELGGEDTVEANDELDGDVER